MPSLYREAPTFPSQTLWALHTTAVNRCFSSSLVRGRRILRSSPCSTQELEVNTLVINTAFGGCSEALTSVTMPVVLVARKEMHHEGHGATGQGEDRALAHSLPANLPHISRLCNAARPGWL